MRILMVTPYLPPYIDGLSIHVLELARSLTEVGNEISILSLKPTNVSSNDIHIVSASRLHSINIPNRITWLDYKCDARDVFLLSESLRKLIDKRKLDVVHAHGLYPCGVALLLAKEKQKVPSVITLHGSNFELAIEYQELMKTVLPAFDLTLCVSNFQNEFVRGIIPNLRSKVLPTGLDLDKFPFPSKKAESRIMFGINDVDVAILFPGGDMKVKGCLHVLEAFRELQRHFDHLRLIIAGRIDNRRALDKKITELGINDETLVLGIVPHHLMIRLLDASDILILPSMREAQSIITLEALALGKIPLVSDLKPLREITEDKDLMRFTTTEKNALVKATMDIISNHDKLCQLASKRRSIIEQKYNIRRMTRTLLGLYASIR